METEELAYKVMADRGSQIVKILVDFNSIVMVTFTDHCFNLTIVKVWGP